MALGVLRKLRARTSVGVAMDLCEGVVDPLTSAAVVVLTFSSLIIFPIIADQTCTRLPIAFAILDTRRVLTI